MESATEIMHSESNITRINYQDGRNLRHIPATYVITRVGIETVVGKMMPTHMILMFGNV